MDSLTNYRCINTKQQKKDGYGGSTESKILFLFAFLDGNLQSESIIFLQQKQQSKPDTKTVNLYWFKCTETVEHYDLLFANVNLC